MDGIFINGQRPRSKRALKEALADDPTRVEVEWTSLFAALPSWSRVSDMPLGSSVTFVGPDPYTRRNFYGTISRKMDGSFRIS